MTLFQVLKQRKARVLFVCLGNSYRSKMAETFANAYGNDVVEAGSAGFAPARQVSQTARRLMLEKELTMPDTAPRRWRPAELDTWDLIVNLCEFGLPKTEAAVVKIPLPDPVGKPEDERRAVRDRIELVVEVMLAQFRQPREEWPFNLELPEESGSDQPTEFTPEHQAMLSWWRTRETSALQVW